MNDPEDKQFGVELAEQPTNGDRIEVQYKPEGGSVEEISGEVATTAPDFILFTPDGPDYTWRVKRAEETVEKVCSDRFETVGRLISVYVTDTGGDE